MKFDNLKINDKQIYQFIKKEEKRQTEGIELIASENHVSPAVMEAMGSILTNKYSEGYPKKRYYAGNQVIDEIELLAIKRAKKLFNAEHVNVQPLSGSPANMAVYFALLKPGDKVMGFSLDQGGHLSHGHPLNFSGKLYKIIPYFVDKNTEQVDMDEVEKIALKEKPKMIIAGFSAYSRDFDWKRFAAIAKNNGATGYITRAQVISQTTNGPKRRTVYEPVRLEVAGRHGDFNVVDIGENVPNLLGQIPLEYLDFVVDAKNRKLIPNPEHGDKQMSEEY